MPGPPISFDPYTTMLGIALLGMQSTAPPYVPFGGDIDFSPGGGGTVRVAVTPAHVRWAGPLVAAAKARWGSNALTNYINNRLSPSKFPREFRHLQKAIDQEKQAMPGPRLRPLSPVETMALQTQTPAFRAVMFKAAGSRGGRMSARRRRARRPTAFRKTTRRASSKRKRSGGKLARLVRGSPAAKRHMAKLRRMQKRRR